MAGAGCLEPRLASSNSCGVIDFSSKSIFILRNVASASSSCAYDAATAPSASGQRILCFLARGLGLPRGSFEIASVEDGHHLPRPSRCRPAARDFADAGPWCGPRAAWVTRNLHRARRLVGNGHVDHSRRLRIHGQRRRGRLRACGAVGDGAAPRSRAVRGDQGQRGTILFENIGISIQ